MKIGSSGSVLQIISSLFLAQFGIWDLCRAVEFWGLALLTEIEGRDALPCVWVLSQIW